MPHNDPIVYTLTFTKNTPPFVEAKTIRIDKNALHRDVLTCAEIHSRVDIFNEDAGRRFKGTITDKLFSTGATGEFELHFEVRED